MSILTISTGKLLNMKADSKYFHSLETVRLRWAQTLLFIVEAGQRHVAKIASALQSILSWHLQRRSAVGWAWRGGTWQPSPLAPTFALWGLRRLVPLPCWQDMLAPPWHGVVPPARMLLSSAFKSFWCPLAFSWGWLCYANAAFSAPCILRSPVPTKELL